MFGGVKTENGKAVSKYNAIKHGLLSQDILIEGEDKNALVGLKETMRTTLSPKGSIENILVDRVIANVWRLSRALKIERKMLDQDFDVFTNIDLPTEKDSYNMLKHDYFTKLIRYETTIENGIYKALHELQRIQSARLGENPNMPMAIDIDLTKNN